jgi:hypothetical protein
MRRLVNSLLLPSLFASLAGFSTQTPKPAPAELFQELQSPENTDSAMQQFLKLKADARRYLTNHLPDLIRRGPRHPSQLGITRSS